MKEIENKENVINRIADVINDCEGAKVVAGKIDDAIFDLIEFACERNESLGKFDSERYYILRAVRDLFLIIEHN